MTAQSSVMDATLSGPDCILSLDIDTWQIIAAYLTRKDLDALWQCGNKRLHAALFQHLTHTPHIDIHPKCKSLPPWLRQCRNARHLSLATLYMVSYERNELLLKGGATRALADTTWSDVFWRDAMQMWSTQRALRDVQLNLSTNAVRALWHACATAQDQATAETGDDAATLVMPPIGAFNALRLKCPHLTSLQLDVSHTSIAFDEEGETSRIQHLGLKHWFSTPRVVHQRQPAENAEASSRDSLLATLDVVAPFHTLHLNRLVDAQPDVLLAMRALPSTLTDLHLSFDDLLEVFDKHGEPNHVEWNEHTFTLPRHLVRLSLENIPDHLLQPGVVTPLQQLEQLRLSLVDDADYGIGPNHILDPSYMLPGPLSQLPPNLHTLDLSDTTYNRLVAHMEHLPKHNALTSLTLVRSESQMSIDDDIHYFKRLVESVVSDAKFQQLETLHMWLDWDYVENELIPSLRGMACMRRLRSISSSFLHPRLYDQWREHLPLPASENDPPLRVVSDHLAFGNQQVIEIDHHCAYAEIANEVFSKLHFEAIHWNTSRSDVQLPPRLASAIHTVSMGTDAHRNQWRSHTPTRVSVPKILFGRPPPKRLRWVRSIEHLSNLKHLFISDECDLMHLRDLTSCALQTLCIDSTSPSSVAESIFNFEHSPSWASQLVSLKVHCNVEVENVTRFMQSLPSTLQVLKIELTCDYDGYPKLKKDEYARQFDDYASASQKERSKREIRYFPPHMRTCYMNRSYVYITDTTIHCMPPSLTKVRFENVLDAYFQPQALLELPSKLKTCIMTAWHCSEPTLNNESVKAPLDALWKQLPEPRVLHFELPIVRKKNMRKRM